MIMKYNEHNHDGNDNYHLPLGSNKLNPTGWRYRSMAYSSQKLMELQTFFWISKLHIPQSKFENWQLMRFCFVFVYYFGFEPTMGSVMNFGIQSIAAKWPQSSLSKWFSGWTSGRSMNTLRSTNSLLLKMAIEIVDLPMKNGEFP